MSISEEHFEEIVAGLRPPSDELSHTQRQELAEARAVRRRLRTALGSVTAGDNLVADIRSQLAQARDCAAGAMDPRRKRLVWRLVPLATAAVIAITATMLVVNLGDAQTAQAELASIHQANVGDSEHMQYGGDPARLAAFLEARLGTVAALPAGDDVDFCGGCTTRFRGEKVTSYMVRVNGKQMSIVISRVAPDTLGFGHRFERDGRTFWACGSGSCSMAAVVLGDLSYIAVGETDHDTLTDVLVRLAAGQ